MAPESWWFRTPARFLLAALAVVCAILAQVLIDNVPRWPAVVFGATGALALVFAVVGERIVTQFRPRHDAPTPEQSTPSESASAAPGTLRNTRLYARFRRIFSGLARPENNTGRALAIRICGLGASALLMAFSLAEFAGEPPWLTAWACYISAVLVASISLLVADGRLHHRPLGRMLTNEPVTVSPERWWPWLALAGILIFAATLRLYRLGELPPGLWHDEFTLLSRGIEFAGNLRAMPAWDPHAQTASWYELPIGLITEVAGVSLTSGRLVSVCFGLAGVAAVFLLARVMLGTVPGLMAAFLLAAMQWDINWSRIGMHNIAAPLFAALAAWLALRGLRTGRPSDFGLAGAALGLGIWVYQASYLFPLVIGLIFLHAIIMSIAARRGARQLMINAAVMALMTALVAAPLIQTALTDSEIFFARAGQTSILGNAPWSEVLDQLKFTAAKHLQMFHIEGDLNGRHNLPGAPMVDFVSGVLLLLGAVLALLRWREGGLLILPFWILVMLLPGILTLGHEAPQSLRSINVIPAVIVLVTLPLAAVWQWSKTVRSSSWYWLTRISVLGILAIIAVLNINAYFVKYAQHPEVYAAFSTDSTMIAFDVRERLNHGDRIFVTRDYAYNSIAGLITSWPKPEVLSLPADVPMAAGRAPRGATIYISPREIGMFHTLRRYYPDADIAPVTVPGNDRVLYYRAIIRQDQLAQRQGLTAQYTSQAGEILPAILSGASAIPPQSLQGDPVSLIADGALHIRVPGHYIFEIDSDYPAEVLLDGQPLVSADNPRTVIEPAVGVHTLQLRGELRGSAPLELRWQPPFSAELAPIPSENLYRDTVQPTGLAGRYFHQSVEIPERPPDALWLLPSLAHPDWYTPPITEPYLAMWDGTLKAPRDGEYSIRAREVFGALTVEIDGEKVIQPDMFDGALYLTEGWHEIRLTYLSEQTPSRFQIWWQPPGAAEFEVIPVDALKPGAGYMFRQVE